MVLFLDHTNEYSLCGLIPGDRERDGKEELAGVGSFGHVGEERQLLA